MAFENNCACVDCEAARAAQAGKPYRWVKLDDVALQAKLSEMEPIMLCEPGTADEPMITDCDADRAALIVKTVRDELARRAAGDVPPEVIWLAGRVVFLKLCDAAKGHAYQWRLGDARTALDEAARLADENPLITESDMTSYLAHAERIFEREAARAAEARRS